MEIKKIVEGMTATEVAQVIDDNFKAAEADKANVNASIAKLTETVETNKTETDTKLSELGSQVIYDAIQRRPYYINDNGVWAKNATHIVIPVLPNSEVEYTAENQTRCYYTCLKSYSNPVLGETADKTGNARRYNSSGTLSVPSDGNFIVFEEVSAITSIKIFGIELIGGYSRYIELIAKKLVEQGETITSINNVIASIINDVRSYMLYPNFGFNISKSIEDGSFSTGNGLLIPVKAGAYVKINNSNNYIYMAFLSDYSESQQTPTFADGYSSTRYRPGNEWSGYAPNYAKYLWINIYSSTVLTGVYVNGLNVYGYSIPETIESTNEKIKDLQVNKQSPIFSPITIGEIVNHMSLSNGVLSGNNDYIACVDFLNVEDYDANGNIEFIDTLNRTNLYNVHYYTSKSEASFISAASTSESNKVAIPYTAKYFRFSIRDEQRSGDIATIGQDTIYLIGKVKQYFGDIKRHSDSVYDLNEDAHKALVSGKYIVKNYPVSGYDAMLSFLIMTDIHSDWESFERGIQYANDENLVDAVFVLGDVCESPNWLRNYDYPTEALRCTKPVLTIPGNHEIANGDGNPALTDNEYFEYFYNSAMIAHNGDIHDAGKPYWYRDFSKTYTLENNTSVTKNIRIIGLDQTQYCEAESRNDWVINQDQVDWLVNILDNTPQDYYLIILSHSVLETNENLEPVECKFTPTYYDSARHAAPHFSDNPSFFTKLVRAWMQGTSINETATNIIGGGIVSVNHTFSTARNGKFIGFVGGHSHRDCVATIIEETTYSEPMYQFVFQCTSSEQKQQGGDIGRESFGKMKDCLTVLTYDWFNNSIKLVRVGADMTSAMTKRDFDMIKK